MRARWLAALLIGGILLGASGVQAQQPTVPGPSFGLLAGGFDYYLGDKPFYPLLSGRFRQPLSEVLAVEASLTAVAAGAAVVCADGPVGSCDGEVFDPLVYPAVGLQLRLPTGRVSPFVGGSIGAFIEKGAMSPSVELGVMARWREDMDVVVEARRRFDHRYDYVATHTTEVSVGVYWTGW